ncbi:hypothetical protein DERP_001338 [Dermatophagoides pteronyssinus]|uniref:Uncharacterized protein n=1 Tax=Dermatophagoides pteronyssinus TaxID=6956 RepID=A0ABQ8JE66_DERPT|nr:hypothetical protein DERP_001338 [Dermatophagoides pteronyssinus]
MCYLLRRSKWLKAINCWFTCLMVALLLIRATDHSIINNLDDGLNQYPSHTKALFANVIYGNHQTRRDQKYI